MKAILYTQYGSADKLEYKDVEKPTPGENQVLVRIMAASVNALDYRRFESQSAIGHLMDSKLLKVIGKVLGADIAGRVEAVGPGVTEFHPGDEVFGSAAGSVGGFAEYACASVKSITLKPANISFEAAAAVPVAAITALQGLRDKAHVQPGHKVLVYGASGGVGTFSVQLAKVFGAEVTAVCSTRNVEMVRSIGADHVIDYTREDFAKTGQRYDVIIAANGNRSLLTYWRALNPGGVYVGLGGSMSQIFQGLLLGPLVSLVGSRKIRPALATVTKKDLLELADLLEAGKITPVIDRRYPLQETPEAIRYVIEEHARGKVIITVG